MIMRGEGTTTKQLKEAPQGAYYLWCNCNIRYAQNLAFDLGRKDIKVLPWTGASSTLRDLDQFRGISKELFVIDHAVEMTRHQLNFFKAMRLID